MRFRGNFKLSDVTTIEVIDEKGTSVFLYKKDTTSKIELAFQNQGKRLKIIIKPIDGQL